jgi:hypothetical protein
VNGLEKLQASGALGRKVFCLEFEGQKIEGVVKRHPYREFLRLVDQIDQAQDDSLFCSQFTAPDGEPLFKAGVDLHETFPRPLVDKFMKLWVEASCGSQKGKTPGNPTGAEP